MPSGRRCGPNRLVLPLSVHARTPILAAGLLVLMTACGSNADFANGPDCGATPVHFQSREYVMGRGPVDLPVEHGGRLGEGGSGSCSSPDALTTFEPVYRFPGVPPSQAIVVLLGDGSGQVLVAADKPAGGWDPDLRAWLDLKPERVKTSAKS